MGKVHASLALTALALSSGAALAQELSVPLAAVPAQVDYRLSGNPECLGEAECPSEFAAHWRSGDRVRLGLGLAAHDAPQTFISARGELIDLSLSCALETRGWGELELGVELSRLDDDYAGLGQSGYGGAAVDLGWQLGAFRTGLTSRYLQSLDASDSLSEGGWTTFDFDFAWRTPWNARLSVGAANVFNQQLPEEDKLANPAADEAFLGRIPYIRYTQDL